MSAHGFSFVYALRDILWFIAIMIAFGAIAQCLWRLIVRSKISVLEFACISLYVSKFLFVL